MKNIFRLNRPLSSLQIFDRVLEINIQAIQKVIEDRSLEEFQTIFQVHGASLEQAKVLANTKIARFEGTKSLLNDLNGHGIMKAFLNNLYIFDRKWFDTLKSTLYMMEEELIISGGEEVFKLWDVFFEIEEENEANFIRPLKIRQLYTQNIPRKKGRK